MGRCLQYKLSHIIWNKANLRDLIAATGLVISNLIQNVDFSAHVTLKFYGWPWKTIGHLFCTTPSFVHHFKSIGEVKLVKFLVPRDLEIWWMTLKNKRAPLLCYIKLCTSFQRFGWIQIWVTVPKHSIWVKMSHVTLKVDRWPWKSIGHISDAASNFVRHFIAIGKFKLELQSGNAQFGSKSIIYLAVWLWNLTDDLEKQ